MYRRSCHVVQPLFISLKKHEVSTSVLQVLQQNYTLSSKINHGAYKILHIVVSLPEIVDIAVNRSCKFAEVYCKISSRTVLNLLSLLAVCINIDFLVMMGSVET